MKKIESSKLILLVIAINLELAFIACIALAFIIGTVDPLSAMIVGLISLANVAVGFYYWKARTENKIKLSKEFGTPIDEEEEIC